MTAFEYLISAFSWSIIGYMWGRYWAQVVNPRILEGFKRALSDPTRERRKAHWIPRR